MNKDEIIKNAIDIQPGQLWQHHKGGKYTVDSIALDTVTDELVVVYFSEKPDEREPFKEITSTFTRPVREWIETVETEKQVNGVGTVKTIQSRFMQLTG